MPHFISRIHDDLRQAFMIRRGATMRPDDVPRGWHKEYPRMPRINLPSPTALEMPLSEVLARRSSFVSTQSGRAFTAAELGTLLGNALGMRSGITRNYPSGGALYPIETYLLGTILEGYAPGVFHYHPKAHALEHLWDIQGLKMSDIVRTGPTPLTQTMVLFTGMWERAAKKYGDWAYHLALFEAGHMSENILLVAAATDMLARPVGGFNDEKIAELLDIDAREQTVLAVLISPPSKEKKSPLGGVGETLVEE